MRHLLDVRNPNTFGNATESARQAGYRGNRVTLATAGYQNIRKRHVARLIKTHMDKVLSSEEVLQKLSRIANTELEDVKSSDVVKTLELLAKHHKLLTDRVETEDKTPANSTKLISDALQSALESLALKRPDLDLSISSEEIEIIAQAAVSKAAGGVTATEDVSESDSKAVN